MTGREIAALLRSGWDRDEIPEVEERVAAGSAIVQIDQQGEGRVIQVLSEDSPAEPEGGDR